MGFSKWERGLKWVTSLLQSFNSVVYSYYRKHRVISFLFLCNGVIYLGTICCLPDFTSDDFYVFSVINSRLSHPVSFYPEEIFFLFFRPISYFSFWISYQLFNANPVLMKILSLGIHLIQIAVLYILLLNISLYFRLKIKKEIILLLLLAFSFHPDVMLYIIHINNRTELLMLLFYTSSLLVLIKYLLSKISSSEFIIYFSVLFLLSALSKQNGIHLPFLVFAGVPFLNITGIKKKIIYYFSAVLSIAAISFSLFNYLILDLNYEILSSLWRKPFSLAGTLLFTFLPVVAEKIYIWFLSNSSIGIIIAVSAILMFLIVFRKYYRTIFTVSLFLMIVSYPRMLSLGGGRVNSIYILWLLIGILIILSTYQVKYEISYLSAYLGLLIILSGVQLYNETDYYYTRQNDLASLNNYKTSLNKTAYPLLAESAGFMYEYNYYKSSNFSRAEAGYNPLIYKFIFPSIRDDGKFIKCARKGRKYLFKTTNPLVRIGENPLNRKQKKYSVSPSGKCTREYSEYSVVVPDSIAEHYSLVFFNGSDWESIN